MADCEYLEACSIFAQFKSEDIKDFWIQLYCKGPKQDNCARKPLMKAGQEVPETLLPNGTHLDSLDTLIL